MSRIGIIGGGVIGLTTAYVLKQRSNIDQVVLFEKSDRLGSKSTTAAGCGIRPVYDDPTNIRLASRGLQFWSNAHKILDGSIGFRRNGYLFLTDEQTCGKKFSRLSSKQKSYGFSCSAYTRPHNDLSFPQFNLDNYKYSMYSPESALASPDRIVEQLKKSLESSTKVEIKKNSEVTDLTNRPKTTIIDTHSETKVFEYVVNASGGWAQEVANMVNTDLPVQNSRRRIAVLDTDISRDTPLTVDIDSGIYVLPSESGRVLIGGHITNKDNTDLDDGFLNDIDRKWSRKASRLSEKLSEKIASGIVSDSWTGLYTMTESRVPIIDNDSGVIHAVGFSGHGIMQAPASAIIVARIISGQNPPKRLRMDRDASKPDIQF